jgi:predicted amidohydrolase YtcJ
MLSRRELLERAAAGAVAVAGGLVTNTRDAAAQTVGPRDLVLTNGKFVDGRGQVGTTLTIRNGRIAAIGKPGIVAPDARKIDLGGRTVVPGFFDGHVHYTRAGVNPGYEARRIERAFSIKELQEAIAQRARSVPPGQFITCIGGWNHTQFTESRRPTKAELDEAAPKHAVYISGTGGGTGAITNSLGRAFFASKGVTVDEGSGVVAMAPQAVTALQALQTAEDKLRGTADLNAHANSLGLTGVINAGNLEDQELALRLWRENKLTIRMRPSTHACSTTSAREGVRSVTISFAWLASASVSAAPTRCRRSSSPRHE